MPRHGRHPALWVFFTSLWLAFFVLFLLPWQTQDRQGWNFTRSVKHDLNIYKGALTSFFSSSSANTPPDHPIQGQVSIITTTPPQASLPEQPVPNTESNMSTEQTFIAIKPDGVQRGLVGTIISRFESRGYKLVAIKLVTPGKAHLEQHYSDLKDKPFFAGLVEYMNSGPIAAMVWEGRDAVKTGRTLLGATNPLASAPGTIRGDFAIDVGRNVCHGSDSVENAKKEIDLWFKAGEVVSWESAQAKWIYEKP
ncbi:nucleoside diphosphate kinase [Whalleya microplaca]|nr:nucleoside diphosphate kinase [Whalleya microplaca]